MRSKIICDDRDMVLKVLQRETGASAIYEPLPDFSVAVGNYTLRRDGWVEAPDQEPSALEVLASLALCDYPYTPEAPDPGDLVYPLEEDGARMPMNLLCMLSARQRLLNRALDARNAFRVERELMEDLLAHPPETAADLLRALYGRENDYRGIRITREHVAFSGFRKAHPEEKHIHRQLADLMLRAAREHRWTKPFTPRVRNQKYAFRVWLNALGMIGPDYEEARSTLLGRLPGRSDQRRMKGSAGPGRSVDVSQAQAGTNPPAGGRTER